MLEPVSDTECILLIDEVVRKVHNLQGLVLTEKIVEDRNCCLLALVFNPKKVVAHVKFSEGVRFQEPCTNFFPNASSDAVPIHFKHFQQARRPKVVLHLLG